MKLCLVILLVATALAVPVPNPGDTQAPSCTENRFTEGKRYVYSYESESLTGIVGTSERLSGLKIDCTVQIQVPEQCELILTLQQCTLKELDPDVTSLDWSIMQEKSSAFNDEMVKYPLLFTMDGGKITSLEAHQAEPLHILNVKKGILSAFQLELINSTKSITLIKENVFGKCSVDINPHYSESKDRIDYIVTETDLTTCDRPSKNVPVPNLVEIITNFNLADKLFTSKQFCKHSINKRDDVDMIKCEERHVFLPMSYMDAGLQSNITQVIVLQDATKENSKPKFDNRESRSTNLVYEFENEKVPGVATTEGAMESLMALVESTLDEVKMDTPRRFTEFVAIIRSLSNETLHEFYPMAYNCSMYNDKCAENQWREKLARQYIYDGLSHCTTQSCFSLINTMIANKEIDGIMAQTMLYTMAMQPYPTEVLIHETLRVGKALRTQSSILTLSTMVHNYWVNNQEIREQRDLPEALYDTMTFLKDIINYDCTAQSNELDTGISVESNRQVLLALKAIGNIGEPVQIYDNDIFLDSEKIIPTLFRCAKNPAAPRNITLAAIQAFRRMNIRTAQLQPLTEILLDTNMDVEIRIAAYLMVMRSSPAKRDLQVIIDTMRTEPVDQIRAFIGSHIQNVIESEEPSLESLRSKLLKILVDDPLPEYPSNILKYSRNIEFSKAFRLPYINKTCSSQFDSNIIYNANGFLPRAAMLNTTLNVLGRSLYMVEFGIDMQGYEQTLEALFGPRGYFPDVVLQTMYTKSKDLLKFMNETYQKKSVEYGLPEKMELLSAKADQVLEMAKPYMDMASPYWDTASPYVQKALKEGKPILNKAKQMVKPVIKKMKNQLKNLAEYLPETYEPTESTGEDLVPNNIMMELEKLHAKVSHLPEPKYIAIYLRAFENELGFTTVEEMLAMIPRLNVADIKSINMQMVIDVMKEISKKLADGVELNMTKSIILVQREWVVPTSMGIPMNVSLNGTSSMALRSLFRMKTDDIKKPMFVEGKFAPSVAVEVAGKMGVTLPLYGETGVLTTAAIYHSSSIAGNVTYKNGRVRFNLKNIKKPMNLFNFSTNFFLVRPNRALEYLPGVEQDRSEYEFCTDVSRLVADDLCVSFAYPNASYAYAARFPLSGPMSFNITLVPTDSVEAFTMEASFRRERASSPKKTFGSIGKSAIKPKLLRDIVHFNFSAPGKELTRNISSLLVVDYQKTEVQWNFTIPEVKAFRIYAGLLNLTDSEKNRVGYHLTYNISAAEIYNASNSLTLISEYDDMNTNCSVIFDTSVMAWRHTVHAHYLNNSGNWMASLNETYYWDNETPVYKQIMWPVYDYSIRADKFHTSYVLVKSHDRECEEVECDRRERVFETSLFRQNFTLKNTHTKKPMSTVSTLNVTFGNDYLVFPIMNFTAQMLDKSEMEVEKYEVTLNASRHERYAAVINDITRIRGEYNHSIRFVYYSLAKLTLPQFDTVLGYPGAFEYYGDALYNLVPSFLNTTIAITLRNETATMEETIKPHRLLGYVNVTYPNPLNLHEQQSVSVVAKIANDNIYEDNEHSYWGHFNTSVPHLQFETSYQAAVVKGQDGVTVGHNFTIVDKKRVQNWSFDTIANWMPLTTNVTWATMVSTPVLNITYDHVQFKNDGGFQLIFNDTVNNTLTNYLNHTVYGHFELKPEYISLNASLWTKMLQIDGSHVLRKRGPIVDFSLESVQGLAKSMYKKARAMDFRALYEETKVVSKNLIDSSFDLTNALNISTPSVANMTLEHMMGFGITGLNDTVKVDITRETSGLGANLFTNFGLNSTCLKTSVVAESRSPIHLMQGSASAVLFKSAPFEIGLESSSHMALKSSKGNASLNGTFFINSMKNPWSFKSVEGTLKYNVTSPIFGAQLDSAAIFTNFNSIFQFEKINGALTHKLTSKVATITSEMSLLLNDFISIFNFNKINGNMVHNMTSEWANASSVSGILFHNFSSLFNFAEASATTVNQLTSKKNNLSSDAAIVLRNFRSAFNFELVKASMNHDMSTSIGNVISKSQVVLDSFTNVLSFIEASATAVNKVSSKLVNASCDMSLIAKNVRSLFNFRLINGTMNHIVSTGVASITSVSQVTMVDSTKMWNFAELSATTSNKLASRLTNVSSDMALVLKDFSSIFSFSSINGNMKHTVDSFLGSLDSDSQLSLVDFTNLFSFEHVNATSKNNIISRMANMTSDMVLLMKNFSSPVKFDLINGKMSNVLNTNYVNGASISTVVFSNFKSPLVFEEVTAVTSNNLSSKWVNVDSETIISFQNFSSLFTFSKVNSTMVHKLSSEWVNATSVSGMTMHDFTSPVSFNEATFTTRNDMTSRVVNLISETDLHFQEFTSLFNFKKIGGSMKNLASSKWLNVASESSVLLNNHSWLFTFEEFDVTTKQNVSSPFGNLTSDVVLHLQDFISIFNFAKINGNMKHIFNSRFVNATSDSSGIINNHASLFRFEEIKGTTTNIVDSRWANLASDVVLHLQNFNSIFDFTKVNGTMVHRFTSKYLNVTSDSSGIINNHASLFKFEEIKGTTTNIVDSRWANLASDVVLHLQNFNSIFNFTKVNGTMVHRFTSKYLNVTSDSSGIINNHASLFKFEEIKGTTTNIVDSRWANLASDVVLHLQNFNSIFDFTKVSGTMVHSFTSEYLKVTSDSSGIINNHASLFKFEEIKGTTTNIVDSRWANLASDVVLHLQNFNSIFDFTKVNGTMVHRVTSKYLNVTSDSSGIINNHASLFRFEEIKGTTTNIVDSRWANLASDVVLRLQNFNSIFNFTKVSGTMVHSFTSEYLKVTSDSSGIINNHASLFRFEEIKGTTTNIVDSRWANLASDVVLHLQNFNSIFDFTKVNGTMVHRVTSKYLNVTSDSSGIINNHASLFRFEEIKGTTTNIVDSRWANLASDVVLHLQNFNSIFDFTKVNGTMVHRVTSKYLNVTSDSSGIINNHASLFKFEEIKGTTTNIVDSRWANLASDVVLHLQNFNSIFDFTKVSGTMVHSFTSEYLKVTSDSSGIINNHASLFRFEEIKGTTTNIVDSRWANIASDVVLHLQNFHSIFNFTKVNGTMVHSFTSEYLNVTSDSSGIINNHASLFRFEEIKGTSSNVVNSRWANLTSDVVLRLQNFISIFNFNKVIGTAVHKLDSKWVNATSDSSVIFHHFTSLFNFSEVNTTSWNIVKSSLVNLTYETALKLKNFRSIFNFDIISGLSRQSLSSKHVNFTTNNSMIVNNHEALFKFEEINATSANALTVLSTNLASAALVRFENFRSIICFETSAVSGNFTLASKMVNATSSNSFVVDQHHALFNFEDISAITDSRLKILSTNLASRMFFGLNKFKSIFSFNKIDGGSNLSIDSRILSGSSTSSMMVFNHSALFVYDEANATTSNKLKVFSTMLDSDIVLKMQESQSFLKFKKLLTTANHGLKSQWVNAASNSSMKIENHRQLFDFSEATTETVNKLNSSLMNVISEAVMRLTNFDKVFKFEKVNGTMRHRVATPILKISSESAVILSEFKSLFNFEEANATTSNSISSRLGNVTIFAGGRRIDSESMFRFAHMNTTLTTDVSLPVFVVATKATTDFVNFRGIFSFDEVNGSSNLIWNKCSFMNSTGRAEFALNDFRSLFDFTQATVSASYNTTTKIGDFSSLTRGALREFRSPFQFNTVCMDTKNILTTPLVVFQQEAGLTFTNSTKFLKFDRFNITGMFDLSSSLVNLNGLETFAVQDMSSLFSFSQVDMARQYNLKSWLANITLIDGIEMHNFASLFNFNRVSTAMDYRMVTPYTEASWISAVELKDFSSLLNFNLINANVTVNLDSKLASFDHFSELGLHNFAGSILKFSRINGAMRNQIKSQLANLNTNSTITLKNFNSFFDFENVNGRISYDLTTPVVNSTLETVIDLLNFSSWQNFNHIHIGHDFALVTKMINAITSSTIHMTKWTVYQQRVSVDISSPVAEITLLQTSDNQSVYVKVTSPKHGDLCFLGKISDDGKLMNMTIYHMTTVDKLNVTDLQWLLMLNQSNVIYSNFSWNPALIDGAFNLANDLIAATVNITMTAVNQTKDYTRRVVSVTKTYMDDQVRKLNETYQNLDVITAEITAELVVKVREVVNKMKEYAVQRWRDAKEFDYDDLWLRTVEEYKRIREDLKQKYADLKEKYEELKTKALAKYEELKIKVIDKYEELKIKALDKYEELKIKALDKYEELKEKFEELVVKIEGILKDKEHLINSLPMWIFEKSVYEIIQLADETIQKMMQFEELKIKALAKYEELKIKALSKYEELKEKTLAKYEELKEKTLEKYEELKEKALEKYEELKEKLEELVVKIEGILKDKDHLINRLPMKYFDKSIYEIIQITNENIQKIMQKVEKQMKVVQGAVKILSKKVKATATKLQVKAQEKAEIWIAYMDEKYTELKTMYDEFDMDAFVQRVKEMVDELSVEAREKAKIWIAYMGEKYTELKTMYDEFDRDAFVQRVTEIVGELSVNALEKAKIWIAYMEEKYTELKTMYDEFDREVFVQRVKEIVDELSVKARDLSTELIKNATVAIDKAQKKLDIVIKKAKKQLNSAMVKTKKKLDKVIEQIVEMSKNESNVVNRMTLRYLDRTVFEIAEELVAFYNAQYAAALVKIDIYKVKAEELVAKLLEKAEELGAFYKAQYAAALVKIDIYKVKAEELVAKLVAKAIEFSLDESHLINTYALKYTGRNVNQLVKEIIENLNKLVEKVNETTLQMYQDAEVKYAEYKVKATEMYEDGKVKYAEYKVKAIEMYEEYKVKAVEKYAEYKVKAVEKYEEYKVKAVEKYKELRKRLQELYEAFKIHAREYYDYAQNKTLELKEKLNALKEKFKNQPLNTSVREVMEYAEEIAETLKAKVDELTADLIQFYEENITEENIMKFRKDAEKYIEERIRPIITKLEEIGEDVSLKTMEVLENTRVLEITAELVEKTLEYLVATRELNMKAMESAQEVIDITRECVESCIKYINNTLPGWIYRYYEIDQIPLRVWSTAVEAVQMKMNQIPVLIRMAPELTLNLTRSAISYSLNSVGQVGEHSFAMNISHPLNYTSFYKAPTLTNKQWEMIHLVQSKTEEVINQVVMYYDETRQYINETYLLVIEWVKEYEPFLREKYEQISEKIEMLRDQAIEKYDVWKVKAEKKYNELKIQVDRLIEETKQRYEEIKEQAKLKYSEIKEKVIEYYPKVVDESKRVYALVIQELPNWRAHMKTAYNRTIEEIKIVQELAVDECKRVYALVRQELPNWRTHLKTAYNLTIEEIKILQELFVEQCKRVSTEAVAKYEELQDKYNELKPVVEQLIQDKYNELKQWEMIQLVQSKTEEVINQVVMYINETYPFVIEWVEEQEPILREKYEQISEQVEILRDQAIEKYDVWKVKAEKKYNELKVKVDRLIEETKQRYEEIKEKAGLKYIEIKEQAKLKYSEIKEQAKLKYSEIKEKVIEYYPKVVDECKRVYALVIQELPNWRTHLKTAYNLTIEEIKIVQELAVDECKRVYALVRQELPNWRTHLRTAYNLTIEEIKILQEMFVEQWKRVSTEAVAKYEELQDKYNELKPVVEQKIRDKYNELKLRVEQLIQLIQDKYNELKQWEMIQLVQSKTEEVINQVVMYINETYPFVIEWVEEQEPILREKYEQISEKVEMLRDQAIEKYDVWKVKAEKKYNELKVKVDRLIEETKQKYEEIKEKAELKYSEIKEQAKLKYSEIKEKVIEYYPKVVDECKRVYALVIQELPNWRAHMKTAYNHTIEEIKIMQELAVDECKRVYALVRQELPNWRTHLRTAYNLTIEEIKILQEMFVEQCKRVSTEVVAKYEELQDKYNELKPVVEQKIRDKYNELKLRVDEIMDTARTYLEKMKLKLQAKYKKLIAKIKKELPNWKEHLNTLANKTYEKFDELIEKINQKMPEITAKLEKLMTRIKALMTDYINKMYEKYDELVVRSIELIEKIKQKIPEIKAQLEKLVTRIKALTPDYIKERLPEMIEYIKEVIKYLEDKIKSIEYPQLPSLPAFTDIIPPFQSTAMIFGPLHVYTFDQKRYELPGYKAAGCTYILASDFVDRNFTIVSTRDTVTLLLQEMSIKVNSENMVQINGRNEIQELPYQSSGKEVKVVRNGQWVEITTTYGLDIKCDAKYAICFFSASHWYYNKTLGLLGTLNEEKHFDMRKPDGSVARDLTEFVNAFEVSGATNCKINPGRDEIFSQAPRACTAEPSQQCRFLFSDPASPLADCFDKVSVTEFITLCEEETRCYPEVKEAICNATTSYVEMCRSRGRHIEHVQECNKCGDKVIGEIWETKNTRTADIVMIVSENMKMAEDHNIAQELAEIVELTDKTLKKSSIIDNRFSLVAFGGADIHKYAHQHTINGKVFANSSQFISGAQSLQFYGDYESDSLEALKLATELELRAEATKIFVLVVEEETDAGIEEQLAIQSLLEKNGITLNVISSYDILKKVKTSKNVVGINWDGKTIMTSKSEKKEDNGRMDLPRGSYAKLAKASKGAVFSLDQLQRQVEDVIVLCAKRIRNQVERPLEGDFNMKECECERNVYGRAVSKCQIIAE